MNKDEIKKHLWGFGLKKGDIVLVHSSLSSIGWVEGGVDTLIDSFLEILGREGTLIAPVFGDLGIFTQTLKNRPEAVISDCPLGTVAAIGADAEFICRDHWKADTVHGHDTPYLKIAELGGYVCLLGVDQDRNTTLHSVEALLELPYLSAINGKVKTSSGEIEKSWQYYPGPHRNFIGLDHILKQHGKMTVGKIGNAVTRLVRSQDLISVFTELGKENPGFCLCDNENCADCVSQHAAIRQARLAKEDFRLCVAASIAGKYIQEMVDNLKSAGVEYIELDTIEGLPAYKSSAGKLKKAVDELRENGIKISALRLPVITTEFEQVLELLKHAGINDLIMPLSTDAENFLASAKKNKIKLSFFNLGLSGFYAAGILKKLKADFVFSPANFAKVGEKPFLESFQQGKFRKYISQLDIEDVLFDGTPSSLAHGNAEIKELISILRCASFPGFMNISGMNKKGSELVELAKAFMELLKYS